MTGAGVERRGGQLMKLLPALLVLAAASVFLGDALYQQDQSRNTKMEGLRVESLEKARAIESVLRRVDRELASVVATDSGLASALESTDLRERFRDLGAECVYVCIFVSDRVYCTLE